mgnify:CR=1 FL=1
MSVNIGNPSDKSVIKEDLEGAIKDNTKGKNKQSTKNLNPNTHWKSGEKITNK